VDIADVNLDLRAIDHLECFEFGHHRQGRTRVWIAGRQLRSVSISV
jgi:hypothetical protein